MMMEIITSFNYIKTNTLGLIVKNLDVVKSRVSFLSFLTCHVREFPRLQCGDGGDSSPRTVYLYGENKFTYKNSDLIKKYPRLRML